MQARIICLPTPQKQSALNPVSLAMTRELFETEARKLGATQQFASQTGGR